MKSLSQQLLDRSVLAMGAAIEIYNKPGFPYRNESFTVLAVNGWELLVKAKWLELHGHKKRSLYVYESRLTSTGKRSAKKFIKKTRTKAAFTHDLSYLAKQLQDRGLLDPATFKNIEIMLEFRDCAAHFYNDSPSFYNRLYEIAAACVKNFVNLARDWFNREVTEFNLHLMPLAHIALPTSVEGSLLNAEETNFIAFLDSMNQEEVDPESPYSVSINVDLRFTKSKSKDAFPVQVTKDPSALAVRMTEQNIREIYPWDYWTLTDRCKDRYQDFKINGQYHKVRKRLENDERYARLRLLDPENVDGLSKTFFNPNILAELDKHYAKRETVA